MKPYIRLKAYASLIAKQEKFAKSKTSITGVANEPWHYRYVGKDAAEAIHQSGMCLEEYIDTLD